MYLTSVQTEAFIEYLNHRKSNVNRKRNVKLSGTFHLKYKRLICVIKVDDIIHRRIRVTEIMCNKVPR